MVRRTVSSRLSFTYTLSRMADGQLQYLKDNRNITPGGNNKFHIMQWLLTFEVTLKDIVAEPIADLAKYLLGLRRALLEGMERLHADQLPEYSAH